LYTAARRLDGTLRLRLTGLTLTDSPLGTEWLVDAHGCEADRLRSTQALAVLFDRIVQELGLNTAGGPLWHVFPEPGGVTGMLLLTESHLACHTFPESGFASFNLYCCRPRAEWPWPERLAESLGAQRVEVRWFLRGQRPISSSRP
jgi:S-adenosylmethionine decarboxylase